MEQQHTTEISGAGEHYLVARKRKRRRNALILGVLAVAAAGGWYWQHSREVVVEDEPLIATVAYGDIENSIASAGSLEASRTVDVGAQVSGQLVRLLVEVGDYVEEGQLLAEIDARVQQNRVKASEASIVALKAQVEAREAALELARQNAERQQRLYDADATSELDYQNAQNNLMSAEASLEQLKAQIQQSEASLETDKTQLEYTNIFAPFSGIVTEVLLTEGVTLNANQSAPTILRVADLSTMTVKTQISEADIGRIHAGMDVYFTTLAGGERRWYSKLEEIWPTPLIENNVVLYTGLFNIDNADSALLSGMTTQVYFVTSAAYDVLTVPLGALTFKDGPSGGAAGRMANWGGPGGASGRGFSGGGFPRGEGPPTFSPDSFPRGSFPSAGAGGFGGSGFGGAGDGGPRFAASTAGGENGAAVPRPAFVTVVHADGTQEEREILVGVMSRISAEVISGLEAGEQVIAGIVQPDVPDEADDNNNNNNNNRNFRRAMRFF